jgi:ribose/xylose/arabinose/galactoside ABC-type transport system permease subunit
MNSEHAKDVAAPPSGRGTRKRFLQFASRFTVQIALLLLIFAFSILSPDFLQPGNWSNIIQQSSIIAIAACGATLVIITAGIDLSVGSVVALSGICSAGLVINQHWPGPAGWFVCIFVGLMIGAFNGFCISRLGLSAFIATLSTLAMGRGLTLALSNGQTVFGLPDSFSFFGGGTLFGVSVPIIVTVIAFTIMHFVLAHTVFGHEVYAIGGNREAARLAGINVEGWSFWFTCWQEVSAVLPGWF